MDEKAIGVSRVYGGSGPSFFNLADAGVRHGYTRIQHGRFGGRKDLPTECQRHCEGELRLGRGRAGQRQPRGQQREHGRRENGSDDVAGDPKPVLALQVMAPDGHGRALYLPHDGRPPAASPRATSAAVAELSEWAV